MKNSVAHPHNKLGHPRTQFLNRVPVGLLPLLSEPSAPPCKPPSNVGSKNTSSIDDTFPPRQPPFLRKSDSSAPSKATSALASKFPFLPLMPVEDQSTGGQAGEMTQSPINPQSPVTPPNRFEKRFQFIPLLPESASCSELSSDDDHASPISTPSLTASSSLPSPPGTPSATSSPSLTPSSIPHLPPSDADYFNLNRPRNNQKSDQLRLAEVDSTFSKLRLGALPSSGLNPPSPFDLHGGDAHSKGKISEKLNNSGHLGRKGGKRRVVEYININGVDEPFYSYVDDDDDEPPSPVEKAHSAADLLPPSKGFLPLYE